MTEPSEFEGPDEPGKKFTESAKRELINILGKIDQLGVASRASRLWRFNSLLGYQKSRSKKTFVSLFLVLATVSSFFANRYFNSNVHRKCLIEAPAVFQKVFRPPEDCSICRDVQQVEKIANVDPVLFEERYAYSGRPVVVTDATVNWTAIDTFSYSFFKNLYAGQDANCQFFPYKTGFESLQDVFNMSAERALLLPGTKPWYVGWSNCDEKIGTTLREHYQRPYFFPETAETEKTDWIFMGSSGYGAPMHVDDVAYPSWQAQIRGTKLWILEPPRECHYTCKRVEVVVQTGEIIILDTNRWYHQTVITSDEMSITIGAEYD
ncbi:uncharacterized protein [Venturia canescens]|uniref:uncharacterized protein n=1 Tax=Venturia canescens TaxID=32260 RepID=UPI001C9CA691|nr:uncharacterized protein LOC122415624 [Venturia canescens]